MAFAESSDIVARWVFDAPLPDVDVIQATLDDAHVLVSVEFPDLAERIDDDDPATGTLEAQARLVLCRMVLRYLQNPDGTTSKTIGSTATSFRVSGRPGLYLDDDDRQLLAVAGEASGGDAFTINPTPAASITRTWATAAEDVDPTVDGCVVNSDNPPSDWDW